MYGLIGRFYKQIKFQSITFTDFNFNYEYLYLMAYSHTVIIIRYNAPLLSKKAVSAC